MKFQKEKIINWTHIIKFLIEDAGISKDSNA